MSLIMDLYGAQKDGLTPLMDAEVLASICFVPTSMKEEIIISLEESYLTATRRWRARTARPHGHLARILPPVDIAGSRDGRGSGRYFQRPGQNRFFSCAD
jgi:hypothetical protein